MSSEEFIDMTRLLCIASIGAALSLFSCSSPAEQPPEPATVDVVEVSDAPVELIEPEPIEWRTILTEAFMSFQLPVFLVEVPVEDGVIGGHYQAPDIRVTWDYGRKTRLPVDGYMAVTGAEVSGQPALIVEGRYDFPEGPGYRYALHFPDLGLPPGEGSPYRDPLKLTIRVDFFDPMLFPLAAEILSTVRLDLWSSG